MDDYKTPVNFRYYDNELLAIFPNDRGTNNPDTCSCYAHIGQHSSCDSAILRFGKSATLDDPKVQALISELTSEGYNLEVIPGNLDKETRQMYQQSREKQLKEKHK